MHRIHPPRSHAIVSTHITRDDDPLASGRVVVVVHTHRVDLTKINPQSVSPLHDAQEHKTQKRERSTTAFSVMGMSQFPVLAANRGKRTAQNRSAASPMPADKTSTFQKKGLRGHPCERALLMRLASLRSSIRSLHFNAFLRISHPLCSRTFVDAAIDQSPLCE